MAKEINDYIASAYNSNLFEITISGILGDRPINSIPVDFEEGEEL